MIYNITQAEIVEMKISIRINRFSKRKHKIIEILQKIKYKNEFDI
jgi:hypothetical protein